MTKIADIHAKLTAAEARINQALVDRRQEVRLVLQALVLGEHVLIVAPPGTAKSMLANCVGDLLASRTFRIQLSKTTEPDELLGPMDLEAFREGRFLRRTQGRMPESSVAILDEVFKGSSAVLNTMLSMMQEGTFFDGEKFSPVPLRTCIGTSNEFPDPENGGRELAAMFDRFLFRRVAKEVSGSKAVRELLFGDTTPPTWSREEQIHLDELKAARAEADRVAINTDVEEGLLTLLLNLERKGVRPGDRRRRKAVDAVKCHAFLAGRTTAALSDLIALRDVLWADPSQRDIVEEQTVEFADPFAAKLAEIRAAALEIFDGLDVRKPDELSQRTGRLQTLISDLSKIKTPEAVELGEWIQNGLEDVRAKLLEFAHLGAKK